MFQASRRAALPAQSVELVVVIPIGPAASVDFVRDTVESVCAYTTPSRRIILADDSRKGTAQAVAAFVPGVEIVVMPRAHGTGGGLYLTLCLAYARALEGGRFGVLLRLDTDALVIGPFPERDAMLLFQNPRLAMGGEIYINNSSVRARLEDAASDIRARNRLVHALKRVYSRYRWRHLLAERTLGRLYKRALAHNYVSIDYVFGGCNFVGEGFLRDLQKHKLLPQARLGLLNLEEDHLFGLLAAVVNKEIADMQTGNLPFGTAWKTLPASPADLVAQGKKIVHSTRGWHDMDEAEVRAFFKERRREHAALGVAHA